MVLQARDFSREQGIAARGRVRHAAGIQQGRPELARNFEETKRRLPILIDIVGNEAVQLFPRHLAGDHVVDQPSEVAR